MIFVKKVVFFNADNTSDLSALVNQFLSKETASGRHVIGIQYKTTCAHISATQPLIVVHSCMVYYSEPVGE